LAKICPVDAEVIDLEEIIKKKEIYKCRTHSPWLKKNLYNAD